MTSSSVGFILANWKDWNKSGKKNLLQIMEGGFIVEKAKLFSKVARAVVLVDYIVVDF